MSIRRLLTLKQPRRFLSLQEKIIAEDKLTALMVTHNMRDALKLGNRLIMMHSGNVLIDVSEEQKKNLEVTDLLKMFEKASGGQGIDKRQNVIKLKSWVSPQL